MAKKVITHTLSEPLNDMTSAKIDINTGTGNLTIDSLGANEGLLASGELEYLEKQAPPAWSVDTHEGQASLTLKADGGRQPGFRMPWQACNGETNWQIHLSPDVEADLTARSGGGNVKLDLAAMKLTRLAADTGGGNMDVVLPDKAVNLSVMARSGAGNVTIHMPGHMAAKIIAKTGFGKVIVDSRFTQVDDHAYQSADYDSAAEKVEISAQSGAGNVSILTR